MINLSYHSDPALKSRLIAHVENHRLADSIAKGTYGTTSPDGSFRGCAVGCSIRSLDEIDGKPRRADAAYNAHRELADRILGGELKLAYLEDRIFEGLPPDDAKIWPTLFARAIPVGADLSLVWPKFAHWMLADGTAGVIRFANTDQTRAAINWVAALLAEQIGGGEISAARWSAARWSAARWSAARWSAARWSVARWSAVAAAAVAAAAVAVAAAADADAAAADAAVAAAADAAAADAAVAADAAAADARQKHYKLMAEALLRFLSEAPVAA